MKKIATAIVLILSVYSYAGRQVDAQQFSLPTKTKNDSSSFIIERIEQSKKTLGVRIEVLLRLSDSLESKLLQIQGDTGVDMSGPLYKVNSAKNLLNKSKLDLSNMQFEGSIENVQDIKEGISLLRDDLRKVIGNINIAKSILKEAVLDAKDALE